MKIISTNTGLPQTITWKQKEIQTGIFKTPTSEPIFLSKTGVHGDSVMNEKVHGGIDKACYLYSTDYYGFWKTKYPDLDWDWGMLGENLSVQGLAENKMHVGDVLEIGDSIVKITQPRLPCYKLGVKFGSQDILKQFLQSGFSGIYVKVLQEGMIQKGDKVYLVERQSSNLTIADIFGLYNNKNLDNILIDKALSDKDLAASIIKDLRRFRENAE